MAPARPMRAKSPTMSRWADAASIIDEATAHGAQLTVVQLFSRLLRSVIWVSRCRERAYPLSIWCRRNIVGGLFRLRCESRGALSNGTQGEFGSRPVPRIGLTADASKPGANGT